MVLNTVVAAPEAERDGVSAVVVAVKLAVAWQPRPSDLQADPEIDAAVGSCRGMTIARAWTVEQILRPASGSPPVKARCVVRIGVF